MVQTISAETTTFNNYSWGISVVQEAELAATGAIMSESVSAGYTGASMAAL